MALWEELECSDIEKHLPRGGELQHELSAGGGGRDCDLRKATHLGSSPSRSAPQTIDSLTKSCLSVLQTSYQPGEPEGANINLCDATNLGSCKSLFMSHAIDKREASPIDPTNELSAGGGRGGRNIKM
jgi:hypothetical protein